MWEPGSCPKDGSDMEQIPGIADAWKCAACGLEVWAGELPTVKEYEQQDDNKMTLRSASYKPAISRSFVALPPGARSSGGGGGRRKKKKRKPDLANRYRLDTK